MICVLDLGGRMCGNYWHLRWLIFLDEEMVLFDGTINNILSILDSISHLWNVLFSNEGNWAWAHLKWDVSLKRVID